NLPPGQEVRVRVRVTSALETFESEVEIENGTASVHLRGRLDETVVSGLERDLQDALASNPRRVVLRAERLESITSAGARALLLLRQKLPFEDVDVYIVGARASARQTCSLVAIDERARGL